jgi:4-amino-4-deoxy-L-arabinose transferase-like glycosyltransferase
LVQSIKQNWKTIILLVLACLILFGANLKTTAFFEEDEPWYAETARNIDQTGDWMTLKYNNQPFFEKPPLYMWSAVVTSRVLGWDEAGARSPSVIYGTLTILAIYLLGMRLFGKRRALYSAIILMTALQYALQSQLAYLDVLLTFCITIAMLLFARQMKFEEKSSLEIWLAYAFLGLGALAKGPVAIVLPLIAIFLYLTATRQLSVVKKLKPITGPLLMLLIATPWYIYETVLYGQEFLGPLVGYHMLNRFLSPIETHGEAWYYFVGVIGLGFFPWSAFIPAAIASWKKLKGESLWVFWAVAVIGFFSISKTKLPGYFLSSFPPLAILVSAWWCNYFPEAETNSKPKSAAIWSVAVLFVIAVLLNVMIIYLALFHFSKLGMTALGVFLPGALTLLLFLALAIWALVKQKEKMAFFSIALAGALFLLILFSTLGRAISDRQPMRPLGYAAKNVYFHKDALVGCYPYFSRDFQFYFGSPTVGLWNKKQLVKFLNRPERVLVMIKSEDYPAEFAKTLPKHYVLLEKSNGVLITNKKPTQ